MNVNVALLRAVNVGGHGKVSMADLRDLLMGLGFDEVKSLLQTGNLVFRDTKGMAGLEIEEMLEREAAQRLGLKTDFMVRSAGEIAAVAADNPFLHEAESDPGHLVVLFLKRGVEEEAVRRLRAQVKGPEIIGSHHRELYIVYPAGIGRSRLTNAFIESRLGTRGTGRNWNSLLRLREMAAELAGLE